MAFALMAIRIMNGIMTIVKKNLLETPIKVGMSMFDKTNVKLLTIKQRGDE